MWSNKSTEEILAEKILAGDMEALLQELDKLSTPINPESAQLLQIVAILNLSNAVNEVDENSQEDPSELNWIIHHSRFDTSLPPNPNKRKATGDAGCSKVSKTWLKRNE